MNNREVLATNVKTLMKKAGIKSQAHLSRITGVSQTQIGNILRHEKAASVDLLQHLANGLNCEPWLLLAPVNLLEEFGQPDFTPLIYCYSRLPPHEQNAVWDMTHELFEATNGFYSSNAEISGRL
jgi:transcriptional regulator with XRE-family HTH domain